jgi:hypothetical protein
MRIDLLYQTNVSVIDFKKGYNYLQKIKKIL